MAGFGFTHNLDKKREEEKNPDYVPKPSIDKTFPGMKKKVYKGRPKGPTMKRKDLKPIDCKLKYGLSTWQLKTMDSFMKLRDGETQEQWDKRTKRRRVLRDDEISKLSPTNTLQLARKKKYKRSVEERNKYIRVLAHERDFSFLKYYSIISRYYSIKYGIRKDDLEVAFYFYENTPFTKDRFNNICVMTTGFNTARFNRFLKNKYIREIIKTQKFVDGNKQVKTGLYLLENGLVIKLTEIYKVLAGFKELLLNKQQSVSMPIEIKDILMEMNAEIMDIQSGRKKTESLEQ